MNEKSTQTIETAPENAAFAFVQELAQGLSRKEIDLPSFPDVAIRVRRVLSDEDVSAKDVVRVVGSEPALAAPVRASVSSSTPPTARPETIQR